MKGILFKPDMIQAIIEGRKTQTCRLEKTLRQIDEMPDHWELIGKDDSGFMFKGRELWREVGYAILTAKPRYQVGETVYVKEALYKNLSKYNEVAYQSDNCLLPVRWYWKRDILPAIFMPEWAARYFISITDVRAERLRIITLEDAIAEGFTSVEEFLEAFIKINHLEEDANPWVFPYTFKQEMIRRR